MDNHCFFKDPTVYSPIRMLITRTFPRKSLYQFRDDFFFSLARGIKMKKSSRRVVEKKYNSSGLSTSKRNVQATAYRVQLMAVNETLLSSDVV